MVNDKLIDQLLGEETIRYNSIYTDTALIGTP